MSKQSEELVDREAWDRVHVARPRMRLPSNLVVGTRNLQRLLAARIRPGMRVLEIGFAPGKQLAYVASKYGAQVTGIDFSRHGVDVGEELFRVLQLPGDLRCENIFDSTVPKDAFDFIYSVGVIEHFTDPRPLVRIHVEMLKPGGSALILIPNYRNIYGRLQRYFDSPNLDIHNLDIMTVDALRTLADHLPVQAVQVFSTGRIDPAIISWHAKLPRLVSMFIYYSLNAVGIMQPFDIGLLSPWLALEITR